MAEGYQNMQGMTPPNWGSSQAITISNRVAYYAPSNGYFEIRGTGLISSVGITINDNYTDYWSKTYWGTDYHMVDMIYPVHANDKIYVFDEGDATEFSKLGFKFIPCF